MKTRVLQFASLILAMRSRAGLATRTAVVTRLCEFVESESRTVPALGGVLADCATLASNAGEWYLAATLRRAQDEIVHSLMPTPGHNIRKIFRRKKAA